MVKEVIGNCPRKGTEVTYQRLLLCPPSPAPGIYLTQRGTFPGRGARLCRRAERGAPGTAGPLHRALRRKTPAGGAGPCAPRRRAPGRSSGSEAGARRAGRGAGGAGAAGPGQEPAGPRPGLPPRRAPPRPPPPRSFRTGAGCSGLAAARGPSPLPSRLKAASRARRPPPSSGSRDPPGLAHRRQSLLSRGSPGPRSRSPSSGRRHLTARKPGPGGRDRPPRRRAGPRGRVPPARALPAPRRCPASGCLETAKCGGGGGSGREPRGGRRGSPGRGRAALPGRPSFQTPGAALTAAGEPVRPEPLGLAAVSAPARPPPPGLRAPPGPERRFCPLTAGCCAGPRQSLPRERAEPTRAASVRPRDGGAAWGERAVGTCGESSRAWAENTPGRGTGSFVGVCTELRGTGGDPLWSGGSAQRGPGRPFRKGFVPALREPHQS